MAKYGAFSGLYFPVFGPEKIGHLIGHFHAVVLKNLEWGRNKLLLFLTKQIKA